MTIFLDGADAPRCRYVTVPACDETYDMSKAASPASLDTLYLPLQDTLDFGMDFGAWMQANGNSALATATWSITSDSPQQPVLGDSGLSANGLTNVSVAAGVGAVPGNAYYLQCIAVFSAAPATSTFPAVPARTLTRRLYIVTVRG